MVRLHHDRLEASGGRANAREDITLLIREFGGEPREYGLPRGGQRRAGDMKEEKTLTRSSARCVANVIMCAVCIRDQRIIKNNLPHLRAVKNNLTNNLRYFEINLLVSILVRLI